MRCKRIVRFSSKTANPNEWRHGNCANKAVTFYVADFVSNEGHTTTRTFGFCPNCSEGMNNISAWQSGWQSGCVFKMPYRHKLVSIAPSNENEAKVNAKELEVEFIKDSLKKLFKLKKNSKFTVEDWVRMFKSALDESVIESVMRS
jgi:hypothetical protein